MPPRPEPFLARPPVRLALVHAYVHGVQYVRARAGLVLGSLTLATAVLGTVAFRAEGVVRGDPMSVPEALYSTIGLFVFAGNRFGFPRTWPLATVYFLAAFIAGSAVVEAVLRVLRERNSLLLVGLRGHTVVCGVGRLGMLLAGKYDAARVPTVLVDRAVPDDVQGSAHLVVLGDMTREVPLRDARVTAARRVFLTAGDDLVNWEAAARLRLLFAAEAAGEVPPAIYCHIEDGSLRESLALGEEHGPVRYFNSYRLAAKALVGRLFADRWIDAVEVAPGTRLVLDGQRALRLRAAVPAAPDPAAPDSPETSTAPAAPDGPAASGGSVAVAVVGLGRFGRAVAEQLCDLLPPGTRLVLYDNKPEYAARVAARLGERYPGKDIRGEELDIAKALPPLARETKGPPPLVLLCTDKDRENLRVAMTFPTRVRTIVRMFDQEMGERTPAPAGGGGATARRELDFAGFRSLFLDALPMLDHQGRVELPDGRRMPRIRTCLRTARDGSARYLAWLRSEEWEMARATGGQPLAGLEWDGAPGTLPADGWWLVPVATFEALDPST